MKRAINTDTILGAAGGLIATVLLISSYRQSESVFILPGDAPPFLVPQLFLYFTIALSAVIFLLGLRSGGLEIGPKHWRNIAVTIAVIVAAAALMKPLGYLAVAPVAVFATVYLLGFRRHLVNLAVSAGFVALLYGMLTVFAKMPLPKIPGLGV